MSVEPFVLVVHLSNGVVFHELLDAFDLVLTTVGMQCCGLDQVRIFFQFPGRIIEGQHAHRWKIRKATLFLCPHDSLPDVVLEFALPLHTVLDVPVVVHKMEITDLQTRQCMYYGIQVASDRVQQVPCVDYARVS